MPKKHQSFLLSAILICVSFVNTAAAAKPWSAGLFEAVQGLKGSGLAAKEWRGESRVVRPNRDMLRNHRLRLNLSLGFDLDVLRERMADHPGGRKAWIGRVIGDPDSEVILASSGDSVAGTIRHQGRLFKLEPAADGRSVLAEVSAAEPYPEVDPIPVGDVAAGASAMDLPAAQADGGAVVDVMVVYTPATRARYGGTSGVEALITLAVAETNQAYQNSQIDARLRLVHAAEVSYTESDKMSTDLSRLTGKSDGSMDEVHALRDVHGADLVSLLVERTDYCGMAWLTSGIGSSNEAYAFSVVYSKCATGYYSFGHELGHNMGSTHDHDNAGSSLYPYSYGYQDPGTQFRTVMAYNCPGGCARVQHFSNPYVSYAGSPTGVVDWADNALSLTNIAPYVATWREAVVSVAPASPSDLTATPASHTEIELAWIDNASDASGFRVERSIDGTSFAEIASLGADATGFSDSGLNPETTYYYRVSAFNGAGSSAYSNDAWATTNAAPILLPPAAPSDLTATMISHEAIALNWIDNSAAEILFEVERSLGDGNWIRIASPAANQTSYLDQGLEPETDYLYRVRAIGDGEASGYSDQLGVTTVAAPVGGCSVSGASTMRTFNRTVKWLLTNTGGTTLTIDRVEVRWPSEQGDFRKLTLDRVDFWRGYLAPSTAVVDAGWYADTSLRQIGVGDSKDLRVYFKYNYKYDTQDDYDIYVHFAEGCSVQI